MITIYLLPSNIANLPHEAIGFNSTILYNYSSPNGYVFIIVLVYSNANSGISYGKVENILID